QALHAHIGSEAMQRLRPSELLHREDVDVELADHLHHPIPPLLLTTVTAGHIQTQSVVGAHAHSRCHGRERRTNPHHPRQGAVRMDTMTEHTSSPDTTVTVDLGQWATDVDAYATRHQMSR